MLNKRFSQSWVCLVWKWLMDSVEAFSTLPDLPNCHIMKSPKNARKISYLEFQYIFPIIPVWDDLVSSPEYFAPHPPDILPYVEVCKVYTTPLPPLERDY